MTGKDMAAKSAELLTKRDRQAFVALHHPDVELWTAGGIHLKGPEAATSFGWAFVEAFPDAKLTTIRVVGEGDEGVAEQVMEGTHTGPLNDPSGQMPPIPPTGKRVVIKAAVAYTMKDGLAKEIRVYSDNMALMAQLGLLPTPAKV